MVQFQEQLFVQGLQNRADMDNKDHEINFLIEQLTVLSQEYQESL